LEQIDHEEKVTVGLNKGFTAVGLAKFDWVLVYV